MATVELVCGAHLPRSDVTRHSPTIEDTRRERRREPVARDAVPRSGARPRARASPSEVHGGRVRRLAEGVPSN
eukprot:scaffold1610_cov55-Phaeocystis_antarctica.AAC.1